jgi:hypothetical protein
VVAVGTILGRGDLDDADGGVDGEREGDRERSLRLGVLGEGAMPGETEAELDLDGVMYRQVSGP